MRVVDIDTEIIERLRKDGLSISMKSLEACKFLVIEEKNRKIIGAGGIGGLFNVPSLQIDKDFQGQGLGKILLEETINEAKKRGYSFIAGSRNPENYSAIKLHDYFGFHRIFRIHYSQGIIRDVIILVLSPNGKIIEKIFQIFNNKIGTIFLSISIKIIKPIFATLFTLPPNEFPNVNIQYMIKNFEKLPKDNRSFLP